MNGEKLMRHIGQIDDDLIIEAEGSMPETVMVSMPVENSGTRRGFFGGLLQRLKTTRVQVAVASVAACLVAALVVALQFPMRESANDSASENQAQNGAAGYTHAEGNWPADDSVAMGVPNGPEIFPQDGVQNGIFTPDGMPPDVFPTEMPDDMPSDLFPNFIQPEYHPSGLPILSMTMAAAGIGDGFGMQAFSTTDVATIIGNPPPIENMRIESLPVFRSPFRAFGGWRLMAIDTPGTDAMFAEIERIAAFFGLSLDDACEIVLETIDDVTRYWRGVRQNHPYLFEEFADWPFSATVRWGEMSIHAWNTDQPHEITIFLPFGDFTMPPWAGARFTDDFSRFVTDDEALRLVGFFLEHFAPVVGFDSPVAHIVSSYFFPAEGPAMLHEFVAYGSSEDPVAAILGYNFNRVIFSAGMPDHNFLPRIRLFRPDFMLSQKIGDYPIITLEEARRLLIEGHYVSTVFTTRPIAEERIAHVDIVYLTHWQEVFMPFYRFKVELPSDELWRGDALSDHGIKTFGWFFVPAVQPEFLTDWPAAQVHFQ